LVWLLGPEVDEDNLDPPQFFQQQFFLNSEKKPSKVLEFTKE